MWSFIVSELASVQNKQQEEASYPEQQQNKNQNKFQQGSFIKLLED